MRSFSKPKRILRKAAQIIIITTLAMFSIVGILRITMILNGRSSVFTIDQIPKAQAALVLGAGLLPDETPSDPLRDRINTAVALYKADRVEKLLMSGDNRFIYYNEPEAMKNYAMSLGIPESDIVLDYAGRRTYDSCYRASAIFGLDEVIVVTQNYHLPRALFLCNHLNLKAVGVPADNIHYLRHRYVYWRVREILASLSAYWDVYILKPLPVLGKYEPIFPTPGIN